MPDFKSNSIELKSNSIDFYGFLLLSVLQRLGHAHISQTAYTCISVPDHLLVRVGASINGTFLLAIIYGINDSVKFLQTIPNHETAILAVS